MTTLTSKRFGLGMLRIGVLALAMNSFANQMVGQGQLGPTELVLEPKDDGLFAGNSRNLGENNQGNSSLKPMIIGEPLEASVEENMQQLRINTNAQDPAKPALSEEQQQDREEEEEKQETKQKGKAEMEEKSLQTTQHVVAEELQKNQQGGKVILAQEKQKEKQILPQDEDLLRPKSCSAILERMHDWNDCWRHHLRVSKGQPWKKPIACHIPVQSTEGEAKVMEETIGAPLYEFAYFQGQGFGRFVEHTTSLCMLAFLLKRPCLVNKAPRDSYNTWGSFIHESTYQWDPSRLHAIPEYANQLEALVLKLPGMEAGFWKWAIQHPEEYETPESLVFPLDKVFPKSDWKKFLEHYSGTNKSIGNKVLVSPNWGDAWHSMMKVLSVETFPKEYGCEFKTLKAMVQNSMFAPSDLGLQLHMERAERADARVWNIRDKADLYQKRVNTQAPVQHDKFWNPAVRTGPHLSITGTVESKPSYGAIHIRTEMINGVGRNKRKIPIQAEPLILVDAIMSCFEKAQPLMGQAEPFPANWWVIADNAPTAVFVAEELHKRGKDQANSSLPALKIFHDYGGIARAQTKGRTNYRVGMPSPHSLSQEAAGKYGHAHMAGSIMDWVALHESKISIVTVATAFGVTGAQGNGKTVATNCGEGMFNILK